MSEPMTNYNERLDEVFGQIASKTADASYGEWQLVGLTEAKQAITSLIKELVAEARIDELKRIEPSGEDRPLIWTTGNDPDLAMTLDERRAELEQNLLKALEEV